LVQQDKHLVVNSGGTALEFANASSAEVYGFHKDSNGDLIVTTTNQGVDNILKVNTPTLMMFYLVRVVLHSHLTMAN
jgi:hypothetical protein